MVHVHVAICSTQIQYVLDYMEHNLHSYYKPHAHIILLLWYYPGISRTILPIKTRSTDYQSFICGYFCLQVCNVTPAPIKCLNDFSKDLTLPSVYDWSIEWQTSETTIPLPTTTHWLQLTLHTILSTPIQWTPKQWSRKQLYVGGTASTQEWYYACATLTS